MGGTNQFYLRTHRQFYDLFRSVFVIKVLWEEVPSTLTEVSGCHSLVWFLSRSTGIAEPPKIGITYGGLRLS